MLRYILIIESLVSESCVQCVDLSQTLLYEKCPCLVSHTCPKHSKCFLESNLEKISDRLNSPFTPNRRSACRRGCDALPNPNAQGTDSVEAWSNIDARTPSIQTIPITLTRSQRKHIRRAAQRMNIGPDCPGEGCMSARTPNSLDKLQVEHVAVGPAYITRIVQPVTTISPGTNPSETRIATPVPTQPSVQSTNTTET